MLLPMALLVGLLGSVHTRSAFFGQRPMLARCAQSRPFTPSPAWSSASSDPELSDSTSEAEWDAYDESPFEKEVLRNAKVVGEFTGEGAWVLVTRELDARDVLEPAGQDGVEVLQRHDEDAADDSEGEDEEEGVILVRARPSPSGHTHWVVWMHADTGQTLVDACYERESRGPPQEGARATREAKAIVASE
jgi:hypothetical protein